MSVHRFMEQSYWWLEHRIAPCAESSQNAYARIVKANLTTSTRWLDLGCGHQLWGGLDSGQRRGLAPGGLCIFHTPNVKYWQVAVARRLPQFLKDAFVSYSEGRPSKDVYPTFYRINTEASVKELVERAGFRVCRTTMLNTSSTSSIFLLGPFVCWNCSGFGSRAGHS
jgi:hypothetical protein